MLILGITALPLVILFILNILAYLLLCILAFTIVENSQILPNLLCLAITLSLPIYFIGYIFARHGTKKNKHLLNRIWYAITITTLFFIMSGFIYQAAHNYYLDRMDPIFYWSLGFAICTSFIFYSLSKQLYIQEKLIIKGHPLKGKMSSIKTGYIKKPWFLLIPAYFTYKQFSYEYTFKSETYHNTVKKYDIPTLPSFKKGQEINILVNPKNPKQSHWFT